MLTEIGWGLSLLFGAATIYYLQLYIVQCIKFRKFKGPLALPLVGNCYEIEAMYMIRNLSKLRKRFGKVFTFFLFSKAVLVVCDPIAVRRILSDAKTFIKGSDYSEMFSIAFGQGLVTSNGEKHKHDRAIFGKYFVRSNVSKFLGTANQIALEYMEEFFKSAKDGKPHMYNIEEFFATLALRVFALFGFGYDYRNKPEKEKVMTKQVSEGSKEIGTMIVLNLPAWSILPPVKAIQKARATFWVDIQEAIQLKREQLARGDAPDDCLAGMLVENMSDKDILDHLATLISAGHDTTAYFSAYFAYLLAEHPEVQDRCRAEVLSVVGDRTEVS